MYCTLVVPYVLATDHRNNIQMQMHWGFHVQKLSIVILDLHKCKLVIDLINLDKFNMKINSLRFNEFHVKKYYL